MIAAGEIVGARHPTGEYVTVNGPWQHTYVFFEKPDGVNIALKQSLAM